MKSKLLLLVLLLGVWACKDKDETSGSDTVYFLVAENELEHGDSYILPLKKSEDIEMARQMIRDHEKKIVVAEISEGGSGDHHTNKDIVGDRTWSWHVSSFEGFYDTTIEILDGWPTYVEENFDDWKENTKGPNGKGRIGFWTYSVVREVDRSELE